MLSDPDAASPLVGRQIFGGMTFSEPADVIELADGMTLDLAGVSLTVAHAPGHTPGSVAFGLDAVLFTGDLLFAWLDRANRPAWRRLPDDSR